MRKRCGKTKHHTPHWWSVTQEVPYAEYAFWCDGKPPTQPTPRQVTR